MTPEEEVRRLNRLIRQYETVWQTTPDRGQKDRTAKQLRELRAYRDRILAVNVVDPGKVAEPKQPPETLDAWPVLRELVAADQARAAGQVHHSSQGPAASQTLPDVDEPAADVDQAPVAIDQEVYHLSLYLDHFASEYLPFLTETRLKLDFKHAIERDGFYHRYQELERRLEDWREAHNRLEEGSYNRDLEGEIRTRIFKLKRVLIVDASRYCRSLQRFARTLVEDAQSEGVMCLNAKDEIVFDRIEGVRLLAGRAVEEGLRELAGYAAEVIDYLSVPEIDNQENNRADRR